jgi:serine/threonine-protein kinase
VNIEPPQVWQPQSLLGQVLDKYEVRGILGEGGMGVVYHAQHTALRRTVAIKVLRPQFAQRSDVIGRLFEEARTVNEIRHSNIVDVIDFVNHSDQTPPLVYTVMELLEGENLAQRIERAGALSVSDAVGIALQVVDALTAVHAVSIIHRDLKPENIFLSSGPDGEEVKLLDFGIAKAFGDREGPNLTTPGQFVGTPEFMAPEQVLDRDLDARTDIYTVGLLLYTMLTGAIPFASSRYGEVMVARLNKPPPSLEGRRAIPGELAAVVMCCLEREPAARYQSAEELKAALEACRARAARRRPARWRWAAATGGVLALLAAGTAAWWLLLREEEPDPIVIGSTASDSAVRAAPDAAPAPASAPTVVAAPASSPVAADAGRPDTSGATAAKTSTNKHRRRRRRPRRRWRRKSHKSHKQKKNVVHGIMDPFSR